MLRLLALLLLISSAGLCQSDFDKVSQRAAEARDADKVEEAMRLYRQALELRPAWAEGWWYLGTLSYDRQQFSEAVSALTRLVQLAPKDANGFAMLGLSEAKLNRSAPALLHLQQALQLGVGDEANLRQVVLFNEALLLLNNGEFGRAQPILDQLAQDPKSPQDELTIALGRAVLGIASTNITADQHDLIVAAGRAEVLAARRETQSAHAAYAELADKYPHTHNVQFAYGRFLLNNHLDDQAVAAFEQEIQNSPQHLLARLGIAGALLLTDPARGAMYAAQAVQLAPKLEEAHYLYGASLLATGHLKPAVDELETAEHLNSDDPRVYFALAKAYQRVDRASDAARARARFAQLNQTH